MSYEFKEEILLDIGTEPNCNYESESNRYYDKIDEIDHVYAQAAKADEYEAKAKAFDEILKVFESSPTKDYAHLWLSEDVVEIICKYKGQLP
ncbi:hypothetical protein [Jeotgalicoccus sp. S0W5]|uniref:hypothetical protein n=1 Tax=Jeotgalicoccus sp. S0W5 TaxID=2527874 RepID=UPI001414FA00|nr:hypothetical protein [Jeotgalicoccus sp. S0W5]